MLNSGCGSRNPKSVYPNPPPLVPALATIAFVVVSGPTSFPNVVVACYSPKVDHAHGHAGFWQLLLCSRSVLCSVLRDIWLFE